CAETRLEQARSTVNERKSSLGIGVSTNAQRGKKRSRFSRPITARVDTPPFGQMPEQFSTGWLGNVSVELREAWQIAKPHRLRYRDFASTPQGETHVCRPAVASCRAPQPGR